MHSSSTISSSSQRSMGSQGGGGGIMHYSSTPGPLLTATHVDSVARATHIAPTRFFPSDTSESTAMAKRKDTVPRNNISSTPSKANTRIGSDGDGVASSSSSTLLQCSSSSADRFLNNNEFWVPRVVIGSHEDRSGCVGTSRNSWLKSRLSFTGDDENENEQSKSTHDGGGIFEMGTWDSARPIMFSLTLGTKDTTEVANHLHTIQSQFQFSMSEENMASREIPRDCVPCKIRAKRGCATHPRSIAERERKMRISGKLKKLQNVIPNMDK